MIAKVPNRGRTGLLCFTFISAISIVCLAMLPGTALTAVAEEADAAGQPAPAVESNVEAAVEDNNAAVDPAEPVVVEDPLLDEAPEELTLVEALRISLANNPRLLQSRVSLLAAESSLSAAMDLSSTDVFASVSGAGTGGTTETIVSGGSQFAWDRRAGDRLSATVVPVSSSDLTSSLQVQYRRPMMREKGRTSPVNVSILSAEYGVATQDNQLYMARQDTVENTVRAYYSALRARELIAISESDVSIAEETVRIAERKLEEGLVAEIEVSRAEIQLAQSQDALVERRRAYRDTLDVLLLAMGLDVGQDIALVDEVSEQRVALDAPALVTEALTNRRELIISEIGIDRQRLEVDVAEDQIRPALDLVGSYTSSGIGVLGSSSAFSSRSYWQGGLEYSLPLGSTNRRERRNIAERALGQLMVDREFLKETITEEVLAAVRRVEAAGATVDIYSANITIAQQNLALARRMVEEGLVVNRDVLEAQVALTRTRTNLLSAQIDYYLSLVSLQRALGRDLAEEMTT